MLLNLVIRGHIRTSFNDTRLNDFISLLKTKYLVNIYINTWSDIECKKTWRNPASLVKSNLKITEETILNYFNNNKDSIKSIRIDNENSKELIGDISGNPNSRGGLCDTCYMPKISWKFYIKNCYDAMSLVPEDQNNNITISLRFDMFSYDRLVDTWHGFDKTQKVSLIYSNVDKFVKNYSSKNKLFLIRSINGSAIGYDNMLMGSFLHIKKLYEILHFNLDNTLEKQTKWIPRQEILIRDVGLEIINRADIN